MNSIEYPIFASQNCTFLKLVYCVIDAGLVAPFDTRNMRYQLAISGVHFSGLSAWYFLIQMLHLRSLQKPTKARPPNMAWNWWLGIQTAARFPRLSGRPVRARRRRRVSCANAELPPLWYRIFWAFTGYVRSCNSWWKLWEVMYFRLWIHELLV